MKLILGGLAGVAAIVAGYAAATNQEQPRAAVKPVAVLQPVVVEMFTSQGCSSCPPADAVAGRLARDRNVVVLTRAVTYWDRLGWKDTLGREANTQLQNHYAARGGMGSGVYTPQVVVQGGDATVGSREAMLRKMIAAAGAQPGPKLALSTGRVTIDGAAPGAAAVTVVALKSKASVAIGNGENGGRRVDYHNVVLDERPIGTWRGGMAEYAVPAAALKVAGADRYALLVQREGAGKILAARYF